MAVMGMAAFKKYFEGYEGGYRCGWRQSEKAHFYRFTEPKAGYPVQIELFSRKPDYHLEVDTGIIPVHIDDDTSSLSGRNMLRYLYCSHFHYKVEKFRFISDTMKYRGIRMYTTAD